MVERKIAEDREEHECCERLTPGCCIDHTAESQDVELSRNGGCDTW